MELSFLEKIFRLSFKLNEFGLKHKYKLSRKKSYLRNSEGS